MITSSQFVQLICFVQHIDKGTRHRRIPCIAGFDICDFAGFFQLVTYILKKTILITSIVGLLISIYDPLPEYYGTAVSVAIWVFSLWVLKKIRNFYIAGKETTTIEKKFDFVAFFVCFPVVTYLAPQISSYQIDGVTSGCFGIQLVWCLKLLYIQFHDPEGNTPE